MIPVLILGCGFTGQRAAFRLRQSGRIVFATSRHPDRLADLEVAGISIRPLVVPGALPDWIAELPGRVTVVHSLPVVENGQGRPMDPTPRLLEIFGDRIQRLIYLSTTGVYGRATNVDGATAVEAATERLRLRLAAERAVAAGPWESLILRPAAIYGTGRGVHASMREGRFYLTAGRDAYISRIHVDDLAAHVVAAIGSNVTGAYPVADEEPCPSREVASFCSELMGIPMPPEIPLDRASETRRSNRRVDGSEIRRLLGIELAHRSYRTGIPACLAEE